MFEKIYSDPFTRKVVRDWSRRLCRRPSFAGADNEDVEQELWLQLWLGSTKFNPQVAHWNSLVTTIVARTAGMMVRAAQARKRSGRRQSLEALLDDDDSGTADALATQDELLAEFEFDHDLLVALANDPDLLDLALRLTRRTVSEVARDTGIGRGALRRRVERLRKILIASDLIDFL